MEALIPLALALFGFVGARLFDAYSIATNIATKPYVDEGLQAQRRFTEERTAIILEKAIDHSDANRQAMMIELKNYSADIKELAAKTDIMLNQMINKKAK